MKMILNKSILFLLIFNYSISQPSTVPPKDESKKDPNLASTVIELKRIIHTKDFPALLKHIHPEIQIGFDDNTGIDAFKEEWSDAQNQSRLWSILKRIISEDVSPARFILPSNIASLIFSSK